VYPNKANFLKSPDPHTRSEKKGWKPLRGGSLVWLTVIEFSKKNFITREIVPPALIIAIDLTSGAELEYLGDCAGSPWSCRIQHHFFSLQRSFSKSDLVFERMAVLKSMYGFIHAC